MSATTAPDPLLDERAIEAAAKALGTILAENGDIAARVATIEDDLDCDTEGSIAQALGELRDEVSDLRARIEEWVPGAMPGADGRRAA